MTKTCPDCHGTGRIDYENRCGWRCDWCGGCIEERRCETCDGEGEIEDE